MADYVNKNLSAALQTPGLTLRGRNGLLQLCLAQAICGWQHFSERALLNHVIYKIM